GGDYVAFYKQAKLYGLFDKMRFASTIAFGVAPHAIGKDHPEGVIAGVHSNYHFSYPGGDRWPINKTFVERYHARWKEYPNFQSEGAYVTLYMLKDAVERANRLVGGWPEDDAIIGQLEGLGLLAAACLAAGGAAEAGHEATFYPSFYPQEIKVETVDARSAAARLATGEVHAYLGADPFAGRPLPGGVAAVESLGSYLVAT